MRDQRGKLKKLKFTDYQLKNANAVRRRLGLGEIIVKKRPCLRCDNIFESMGVENRLCETCMKYSPSHADWGVRVYGRSS